MAPDRLVFWVATDVDTEDAADWYLTPYATITGASSLARTGEADLVVETVGWRPSTVDAADDQLGVESAAGLDRRRTRPAGRRTGGAAP